jgi:hypothetical protein
MYYQVSRTIPPNTSKDNPLIVDITVNEPYLWGFYIFFPPGPCGLAGFRIRWGLFHFFPASEGEWFRGDDITLLMPIGYWLEHPEEVFTIEFFNEDDTYEHTLTVGLLCFQSELEVPTIGGVGYGGIHRPF